MILTVPIIGKLIKYDPKTKVGIGSDNDPIAPLDFNKLLPEGCDFKWKAVMYDFEEGMAIVEITFAKKVTVTRWDESKDPPEPLAWEKETDSEFYKRQINVERIIQETFADKTADELYKITGEKRLVLP